MDHAEITELSADELIGMGTECVSCGQQTATVDTGHGRMCAPCDEDMERYYAGDPADVFFGDDGFMIEMHDDGPVII